MTDPLGWIAPELARLEHQGLRRRLSHRDEATGVVVRNLLSFSSNDYLNLASDPRLAQAASEAAARWGAGAGASRLITGGTRLHRALEEALAAWKGTEDAVVFSSGYLANSATIPALVGNGDAVFSDALNHASIVDGCRLSGAQVVVYPHADAGRLDELLAATPARRRLVVTDGVFSMDGDTPDLNRLVEVTQRHGAMLLIDDAHGCGVLGPDGTGTAAAQGAAVSMTIGTLSKAFGAAGGYLTGPADVCEWLRNRARGFVFDTAPAPAVIGAALEGLRIAVAEPWRRERATLLAMRLAKGLAALGGAVGPPAACVVPLLLGDAERAMSAAAALAEQGVHAVAIRPPSVPAGGARLRFVTTAGHCDADVDRLLAAVAETGATGPD